jgi:hypothetical protein
MYDELVVIGGKIFEARKSGKKKYLVKNLGVFFDDEVRQPTMSEWFLYLVRRLRKVEE